MTQQALLARIRSCQQVSIAQPAVVSSGRTDQIFVIPHLIFLLPKFLQQLALSLVCDPDAMEPSLAFMLGKKEEVVIAFHLI